MNIMNLSRAPLSVHHMPVTPTPSSALSTFDNGPLLSLLAALRIHAVTSQSLTTLHAPGAPSAPHVAALP